MGRGVHGGRWALGRQTWTLQGLDLHFFFHLRGWVVLGLKSFPWRIKSTQRITIRWRLTDGCILPVNPGNLTVQLSTALPRPNRWHQTLTSWGSMKSPRGIMSLGSMLLLLYVAFHFSATWRCLFVSLQTKERRKHLQQAKHTVSTVLEQRLSDLFNDWCGFMGKIVGSIRFLVIYMFIYDGIRYTNRWQKFSPSRLSRSWCRSYARLFVVNFRPSFIYFLYILYVFGFFWWTKRMHCTSFWNVDFISCLACAGSPWKGHGLRGFLWGGLFFFDVLQCSRNPMFAWRHPPERLKGTTRGSFKECVLHFIFYIAMWQGFSLSDLNVHVRNTGRCWEVTLSTSTSHLVVESSGNPNPRRVGQVDPMAFNRQPLSFVYAVVLPPWPPSFASTITVNMHGILATWHLSTSKLCLLGLLNSLHVRWLGCRVVERLKNSNAPNDLATQDVGWTLWPCSKLFESPKQLTTQWPGSLLNWRMLDCFKETLLEALWKLKQPYFDGFSSTSSAEFIRIVPMQTGNVLHVRVVEQKEGQWLHRSRA